MVMPTALLDVSDLSLAFGSVIAFEDVSFTVDAGELMALIGPNGAGKSSIFNVLSRIYRPSRGTVTFGGDDLLRCPPRQLAGLGIARSFQNLALFRTMSVLENVLLGRHHLMRAGVLRAGLYAGPARAEEHIHRDAALASLEFLGVAHLAHASVGTLPYGLQKRVELARCLAMEPRLLLLDEPVAGMGAREREQITDLVRRIHAERGLTVLLVEHDMGMVMSVAQRVMVLDFGRVIAVGPPDAIQHNDDVLRAYLGAPKGAVA